MSKEVSEKERKIQKALGTMPLCDTCKDKGEYLRYFQYSTSSDVYPCEDCMKGLFISHLQTISPLTKNGVLCKQHPDYKAIKSPEVLCDVCWAAWLKGTFYEYRNLIPGRYVQNVKIEEGLI